MLARSFAGCAWWAERQRPPRPKPSGRLQIAGRSLTLLAALKVVLELVALAWLLNARALHVGDVQEDVFRAVVRLNEAVALGCVEPLYRADRHGDVPFVTKGPPGDNAGRINLRWETDTGLGARSRAWRA